MSESMIEIYLPDNDIISEFNSKKKSEKLKIIELGLSLFNKGSEVIQLWNNNDWENKINLLEDKLAKEKQQSRTEKAEIVMSIKKQEEDKYISKIDNLNKYVSELEERNKTTMSEMQSIYTSLDDKFQERITSRVKEEHNKSEARISDLQSKLDQSREQYETLLGRTNNSTFKGQDGETQLEKQLTLMFPKAEIQDTSQTPGRGDFIMKEGDFVAMFENKNYSKNVQKSEIDKFYRDLERESNNDIQCAVFVSMNTGICNREDFCFEVVNKKPIIFIHKLKDNMSSLKMAINFFKNILSLKDLDLSDKNIICSFKNVSTNLKRAFTKQKTKLDKYHSEQVELITQQEDLVLDLFKIVGLKY